MKVSKRTSIECPKAKKKRIKRFVKDIHPCVDDGMVLTEYHLLNHDLERLKKEHCLHHLSRDLKSKRWAALDKTFDSTLVFFSHERLCRLLGFIE